MITEEEKNKKLERIGLKVVIGIVLIISFIIYKVFETKLDPCECVTILGVTTQKVGVGMPIPVANMSNEEFKKYKECYEEYAGPASAWLECNDKNK